MSININSYTLIAVIVIALIFLIAYIYEKKRRYDSIDHYIQTTKELKTYKENKKQYDKKMNEISISNKSIAKTIINILINKFIKND